MRTPRTPLRIESLTIGAGTDVLLDSGTIEVGSGEVLAVTGAAGSGKTLLLRALAGLPPPGVRIGGTVRADGRRLLVTADGALTPHRTVGAHFAELLACHGKGLDGGQEGGLDGAAMRRRAVAALDRMHVPDAGRRLSLYPHHLSDALRWRVVLALALAAEPDVLLADAPAAGLDPTVRARLLDRLAGWARETGAALVLAGRPETGVTGPATRCLTLDGGRLHPSEPAGEPAAAAPDDPPPGGAPVLSVRGLRVAFPLGRTWRGEDRWLTVLDGIGFGIAEGEALTVLGESGSGKSVLVRAVLRLVPPAGGRVAWMSRDLNAIGPDALRRLRRDLQFLFPDPAAALDPLLTIGAQLAMVLEALRPDMPADRRTAAVAAALKRAGLPADTVRRHPAGLTAAEAARVGLARALLPEPRLLVCDEPAGTLGAAEREAFLNLLTEVRRERGVSLLTATQDAGGGLRLGHRALVLLAGRVVESADSATLAHGARHPYTRALIAASAGRRPVLEGDPPSTLRPPTGCALRLRCPRARDFCAQATPALEEIGPGHHVACHYWDDEDDGNSG